jgi:hypothetical protein
MCRRVGDICERSGARRQTLTAWLDDHAPNGEDVTDA